jgi:Transcriptional regulator, AbiEi antitoxin, Type IV TA system/Transcriptional regulator, AbiEi antitoxin N-terminal domain
MGTQKQEKLNWMQRSLPEGLVADAAWLEKMGYSGALRKKYVAHGWLDRVARGVYRRPSPQLPEEGEEKGLSWESVVISLQTLLKAHFVVGGRTALELQGFAHYLSSTPQREVHLYGTDRRPGWVLKLNLESRFVFHNAKRLFPNDVVLDVDNEGNDQLTRSSYVRHRWGKWDWPLVLSSSERAILELLDELPERETFHQADMLFEGLRNLSPRKLQPLLRACRSVKVKRLFLWFAERHRLPWLNALDRGGIDLGKGKRVLAKGGKLDPKFNITVPESLDGNS